MPRARRARSSYGAAVTLAATRQIDTTHVFIYGSVTEVKLHGIFKSPPYPLGR